MSGRPQRRAIGMAMLVAVTIGWTAVGPMTASAQQTSDLSQLSLEDLTKIEVSSVGRREQQLFETPAAVFVITNEDIRRSGIRSIPELMRMVPGMQVAQLYANEWAVSSRGFNSRFADKMLVLIDGRSVYSEIYSGVYWDQNDLLLEDIDRIEVIRGPGGTLWGANAVNGIIDIITLKAERTQGALVTAEVGRLDEEGAVRFGGSVGKHLHYRSYVKFLDRNQLVNSQGTGAGDAGNSARFGVRADLRARPADSLTFQADIYRGRGDEKVRLDASTVPTASAFETAGGFALARWEHSFANWDTAVQSYFNQEDHTEFVGSGRESWIDFNSIAHLPRFKRNEPTIGVGYRVTTDRIKGAPLIFTRSRHRDNLSSFFVEDDLALLSHRVKLTGGFKLLDTSFTGVEIQPDIRVLWTPNQQQTLWAAASRAVRTPSIVERDIHFVQSVPNAGPIPTDLAIQGSDGFRSEVVHAYEVGYRQAVGSRFSIDLAGFYNRYKDLRSETQLAPYLTTSPETQVIVPIVYGNLVEARSDGLETAVAWTPTKFFRIDAAYSWINSRRWLSTVNSTTAGDSWLTPTNTLSLRGTWEFARRWSFYSSIYTVSQLPNDRADSAYHVSAYLRADTRLSFSLKEGLQISAGGENLQSSRHLELNPSNDGYSVGSQVPRSAFVKILWSF